MLNPKDQLDAKLASPSQEAMREVVRSLPEESVSMAWRSSLNEELLKVAAQSQRKRRFAWVWRPAVGLAFASAMALVVVMRSTPPSMAPSPSQSAAVEAALVSAHEQVATYSDVTTVGLNPVEVAYGGSSEEQPLQYDEVDVETL